MFYDALNSVKSTDYAFEHNRLIYAAPSLDRDTVRSYFDMKLKVLLK